MIGLLQRIVDQMLCWIKQGIIFVLNETLAALGALWAAVVGLLPPMPGYPDLPGFFATSIGWLYWAFPMGWLLTWMTLVAGLWLAYFIVAPLLRWLKAVDQ